MEILELIENLEDIIERAITVPLSGKSLIDKDELLDVIEEIRLKLPDELKQANGSKTRDSGLF